MLRRLPHDDAVADGGAARLLQRQRAGRPGDRPGRRRRWSTRAATRWTARPRGPADARGVQPPDGRRDHRGRRVRPRRSPTCGCPRRSDPVSSASTPGRGRSGRAAGRTPGRRPAPARPGRTSRRASPGRRRRSSLAELQAAPAPTAGSTLVGLAGGDGEVPAVHQHLVERDHAHRGGRHAHAADLGDRPPTAPGCRQAATSASSCCGSRVAPVGGQVVGVRRRAAGHAAYFSAPSRKATVSPTKWSSIAATEVPAHGVGSVSWSSRTPATTRATSAACGARSSVVMSGTTVRGRGVIAGRRGSNRPIGCVRRPVSARSARISPTTGTNLKPCPEKPQATVTRSCRGMRAR